MQPPPPIFALPDSRPDTSRRPGFHWLLLTLVALIVHGSLYPFQFDLSRAGGLAPWPLLHTWPGRFDRFLARDVTLNLLLYFPVGMAAFLALTRHVLARRAVLLSTMILGALSACLEIFQVYIPGRDPSLTDVVCNTAGSAAGALVALRFGAALTARLSSRGRDSAEARPATLLLAGWAVAQCYPLFPALSQHQLKAALSALGNGPLSAVEVWAGGAEWFAAALALRAACGRPFRSAWAVAAGAWIAGRLLIAGRAPTPSEVSGAALALLLWIVVPDDARCRAGACFLGVGLLLRELTPFHCAPASAPLLWMPFSGAFDGDRQWAVVTLARKSFDYGAEVWLLRRAGLPSLPSAAAVSSVLLVCEVLQRHLPGRTAEVTDAVLPLLMSLGVRRKENAPVSHSLGAPALKSSSS